MRSGQCNSCSRPANCRRNSSSAPGPAGGRRSQGAAATPAAPPLRAARSTRTVVGSQRLRAFPSLPLQGAQSRQLRRQPRAQRPEVWTRGAQRRRPREALIPVAGPRQREGVEKPIAISEGKPVSSRTPTPSPSHTPFPLPQGQQVPGHSGPLPRFRLRPLHESVVSFPGARPLPAGGRPRPRSGVRGPRPAAAATNQPLRAFGAPIGAGGSRTRPQVLRRGELERRGSGNPVQTRENPRLCKSGACIRDPSCRDRPAGVAIAAT